MKRIFLNVLIILFIQISSAQSIGIGTSNPDSSSQLEITSTTKGFLPPRMTFAQRNAITNPVSGLMIWNTDCLEIQVYNGTVWTNMIGGPITCVPVPTVTICDQVWMQKNLDVDHYRNGDIIPHVTDSLEWQNLTTGAWCYYNNDSATYAAVYGKLYNWFAVNDGRGLAPLTWHVPSEAEWTNLTDNCLGGLDVAGGKMKDTGTAHWINPNTGATNSSGFAGLPGGQRYYNNSSGSVTFGLIGQGGYWWSSTPSFYYGPRAWFCRLAYNSANAFRTPYGSRPAGFSVRCVRD